MEDLCTKTTPRVRTPTLTHLIGEMVLLRRNTDTTAVEMIFI